MIDWTIITLGSPWLIAEVLWGISAMFSSTSWVDSGHAFSLGSNLVVASLIALLGSLISGVVTQKFQPQQVVFSMLMFAILFAPKVDLVVVDDLSGESLVVDDVPLGIAVVGHVASVLSSNITDDYEQNLGVVASNDHSAASAHGFLDPLYLLYSLQQMTFVKKNSATAKSMVNYYQNCLKNSPNFSWDRVLNQADGDQYLFSETDIQNHNVVIYIDDVAGAVANTSHTGAIYKCHDAGDIIELKIQEQVDFSSVGYVEHFQMVRSGNRQDQSVRDGTDVENAAVTLLGNGIDAQDYMMKVFINNLLPYMKTPENVDNDALENYITQKTQVIEQWREAKATEGSVFLQNMQNIIQIFQVIFYAVSPLIAIVVVATGFRSMPIIGSYLFLGLWAHSWMPFTTIINSYIETSIWDALTSSSGGVAEVTIGSLPGIYNLLADKIATGGTALGMVPIIALGVLGGSAYSLTSASGQFSASSQASTNRVKSTPLISNAPIANSAPKITGKEGDIAGVHQSGFGRANGVTITAESMASGQVSSSRSKQHVMGVNVGKSIEESVSTNATSGLTTSSGMNMSKSLSRLTNQVAIEDYQRNNASEMNKEKMAGLRSIASENERTGAHLSALIASKAKTAEDQELESLGFTKAELLKVSETIGKTDSYSEGVAQAVSSSQEFSELNQVSTNNGKSNLAKDLKNYTNQVQDTKTLEAHRKNDKQMSAKSDIKVLDLLQAASGHSGQTQQLFLDNVGKNILSDAGFNSIADKNNAIGALNRSGASWEWKSGHGEALDNAHNLISNVVNAASSDLSHLSSEDRKAVSQLFDSVVQFANDNAQYMAGSNITSLKHKDPTNSDVGSVVRDAQGVSAKETMKETQSHSKASDVPNNINKSKEDLAPEINGLKKPNDNMVGSQMAQFRGGTKDQQIEMLNAVLMQDDAHTSDSRKGYTQEHLASLAYGTEAEQQATMKELDQIYALGSDGVNSKASLAFNMSKDIAKSEGLNPQAQYLYAAGNAGGQTKELDGKVMDWVTDPKTLDKVVDWGKKELESYASLTGPISSALLEGLSSLGETAIENPGKTVGGIATVGVASEGVKLAGDVKETQQAMQNTLSGTKAPVDKADNVVAKAGKAAKMDPRIKMASTVAAAGMGLMAATDGVGDREREVAAQDRNQTLNKANISVMNHALEKEGASGYAAFSRVVQNRIDTGNVDNDPVKLRREIDSVKAQYSVGLDPQSSSYDKDLSARIESGQGGNGQTQKPLSQELMGGVSLLWAGEKMKETKQ